MRNTLIVSCLLLLAVVGASIFYFSGLQKDQKEVSRPLTFLPQETLLIAAFKNDETTDNIFKDFEIFEAILGRAQHAQLQSLKQKLLRSETLNPYLADSDIFLSFHSTEQGIEWLFTVSSNDLSKSNAFQDLRSFSKGFKTEEVDTLGQTFFAFTPPDADATLYVAFAQEVFFASYSKPLLLEVLDQKQPKLTTKQIEHFLAHTNRNVPLSLYFAHERIGTTAQLFLRNKPGDFVRQFLEMGGQSTWNINYKQDALILTGESELEDSDSSYIALFARQRKMKQHLYQRLPANTAMYLEYAVSDTTAFREDLKNLLVKRNEYQRLAEQVPSVEDVAPHLGGQFALAELSNGNYLGLVALTDTTSFLRQVERFAERVSQNVYRFRNSHVLYKLYGDAMKPFQRPYFAVVDDVLIVANSASSAEEYLRSVRNGDFLVSTIGFKNAERLQSNEANVTFFLHTKNALSTTLRSLPREYANIFKNKENYGFQDFYSWSAQLSGNNGDFVSSIYASYKSSSTLGVTPDWTYQLNHRLITRPYVFEHSDTSQFILLQEQDHTVHGIHPNGTKLWSSVFSGRIVGDVVQLPDRSIVLVTDRNRLYRFYPDGKPYPGFSTGTPYEPTGTPYVADMSGTSMIFVPTRQHLLAYTLMGAPAENWNPTSMEGQLLGSVYKDGEYIVVGSTAGIIYYLDATGAVARTRQAGDSTTFTGRLAQIRTEGDSMAYAAMDTKGRVLLFNPKDTVASYALPINAQDIRSVHFHQLAGTHHPEMIVFQANRINVFEITDQLREVYHYNFTREVNRNPLFFRNADNQPLLGISAGGNGLIYLLKENGSVVEGFPIEALPLFFYGKINYNTGNFLLCSRRDHKLYAYRH